MQADDTRCCQDVFLNMELNSTAFQQHVERTYSTAKNMITNVASLQPHGPLY